MVFLRPFCSRGRIRLDKSRPAAIKLTALAVESGSNRCSSLKLSQRLLATHAAIYNTFYTQRHLVSRPTLRRFRAGADQAWVASTA